MNQTMPRRDWRALVFRVVASLVAALLLLLFEGLAAVLEAFTGESDDPAGHWQTVQYGALTGVLLGAALLASVPRPRSAVAAMQVFVVASLGLLAGETATQGLQGELVLTFAVTTGLPVLAHPTPRALLSGSRAPRAVVVLGAVTALLAGVISVVTPSGGPTPESVAVAAALLATAAVATYGGRGRLAARLLLTAALLVLGAGSLVSGAGWPAGLALAGLLLAAAWAVVTHVVADAKPDRTADPHAARSGAVMMPE